MRLLTRSSQFDRQAGWLAVLAGTVGAIFFFAYAPEMALAEGITGRVSLTYAQVDSRSTDATGTTTDSSFRSFLQQYNLNADKNLYPNLRLFASGLLQKVDSTQSTNGQGTWSDTTVTRPYIDLTLRTPVFSAGVNYNKVTTESKALNTPPTTFISEAYGGILGWKPEGLPTLDMTLTRNYNYDLNRAVQDTVSDTVSLFSTYDPTKTVRLRYQGSYLDSDDRLKDVFSKTIGNDIRINYDDEYLHNRVIVSTYYEYSHSTMNITTSGKGTVNFQVLAVDGLSLNSDNLLMTPLLSSPFLIDNTTTGPTVAANNIGSATSATSPPDTLARNIGLQFAAATEMNTLNVSVFSVTGATIDTAVPAFLPDAVAGAFTWAVYTSLDNVTWQRFQTGGPAPYEVDAAHPGVGRFVITFPNVVTKFIKVVVSPLSPFAVGGQGRDFPGIFVTELQAFIARPAASVEGTSTSASQIAALSTKVVLMKTPGLNYDFSYFYNQSESQFSTTRFTTMSNQLSVQHQFNPVFSGSAQVARVDDTGPTGHAVSLRAGSQFTAVPLRTLSHSLGFSSTTRLSPSGRSKGTAWTLTNTAQLYQNITLFLNGGVGTNVGETDQKTGSTNYTAGLNMIPIETLNITLSSSDQKIDQSGGGVPDNTTTTRSKEVDVSYYPFPTLYLFASWVSRYSSGSPIDRLKNFGLNWSPFPGGDLVFNFSYSESQRALDNSIDKTGTSSLRWNVTHRTYALISYNSTKSTSNLAQSTSRTTAASLNMNF
jgi:hypothetical protein